MTLLTLVTQFAERKNLPVPATVMGSTDPQVVQIRALLEKEGIELAGRGSWEGMTREATHTTIAAEDQGAIATIAAGFKYIKNQTIWDRTDKLPVVGPATSQDWQYIKAMTSSGPRYRFRIRGGKLLVNPTPTAGKTWAFEYASKYWILDTNGTTLKALFTADTDTVLLPEEVMALGLEWRWSASKGLSYEEDFRAYELMRADASGRDGGKPVLNMSGGERNARPHIIVSRGPWPL